MLTPEEIKSIGKIINRQQNFILTSHVHPDGDAIGSEIALQKYLQARGKSVKIINTSPTPDTLRFLDTRHDILVYDAVQHLEHLRRADVLFVLDTSEWHRLRELGDALRGLPMTQVCIDHHLIDGQFVEHDFIHSQASSTGELIFALLKGLDADIDKPIAEALYAAIMTDTGNFRFSNTTPTVMRIAAELMEAGIDRKRLYEEIYESQSLGRLRLMAKVLDSLELEYDGKLAWMNITQAMLRETHTTLKDVDGFTDMPRTIRGVEIALIFTELENGKVKVSLRSKGNIAINGLAKKYSGGGHAFAAGATIDRQLKPAITEVVRSAGNLFLE